MRIRNRNLIFLLVMILTMPIACLAEELQAKKSILPSGVYKNTKENGSDTFAKYGIQKVALPLSSTGGEDAAIGTSVATIGYDFVRFSAEGESQVTLRGGISHVSTDAHAGVQLTIDW